MKNPLRRKKKKDPVTVVSVRLDKTTDPGRCDVMVLYPAGTVDMRAVHETLVAGLRTTEGWLQQRAAGGGDQSG